jgi:hypothetical protein
MSKFLSPRSYSTPLNVDFCQKRRHHLTLPGRMLPPIRAGHRNHSVGDFNSVADTAALVSVKGGTDFKRNGILTPNLRTMQ